MSCSYADGLSEYHDKVGITILWIGLKIIPKKNALNLVLYSKTSSGETGAARNI